MNKFGLGVLTACLFTTKEGRELFDKTSRVAVVAGDKMLKAKLGVDVRKILQEDTEGELE